MAVPQFVIVLNAGSSSVKFSIFQLYGGRFEAQWRGQIDGIGAAASFTVWERGERIVDEPFRCGEDASAHKAAFATLLAWLFGRIDRDALIAAGHRVVHGGGVFTEPVAIDATTLAQIEAFAPLAPLHQPQSVAGIRALAELAPDLPQIACFDTAFHSTIAPHITALPLPKAIRAAGVRRYGFHGLSYENVVLALAEHGLPSSARVVAAHLGNGASLCAIRDGRSVDTTMSFTALDGLIMGTRPGSLDPGVLLHLMATQGAGLAELEDLLYKRSGLLGLSGETQDMRALLASSSAEAALAIDCFVHRVVREIGAMATTLGGLDGLVFTAGMGERSAVIRQRVCAGLGWLGVVLDAQANAGHQPRISAADSRVPVLIVCADEERVIARHILARISRQSQAGAAG
jgi:acetate kinase